MTLSGGTWMSLSHLPDVNVNTWILGIYLKYIEYALWTEVMCGF